MALDAMLASLQTHLHPDLLNFITTTSRSTWLCAAGIGYLTLCRVLRYRNEASMRRRYGFPDRDSLKKMTTVDAHKILCEIMSWEFPQFAIMSLQFGLFKTYGVETISQLLVATRNLTDPILGRKRYEDTSVLIGEFTANPPDSARYLHAIARMNYLHSHYIASGKISNDDMLYTLSVFVVEPERFMRLYEWRPLNEMEHCAYAVHWKAVGDAMGIEYEGTLERAGQWEDGLDFARDITAWAKAYEVRAFVPSDVSHKPAIALIPMIAHWVPRFGKRFVHDCVTVLLGDRARDAFMLPEPGLTAAFTVHAALFARRTILRYLSLPRMFPMTYHHPPGHESVDKVDGRIQTLQSYGNYPFYVQPSLSSRWFSLMAILQRLTGASLPGDKPAEYMSNGFTFEDLGPTNRMGQGKEAIAADVAKMKEMGMSGCPFAN